MTESMKWLVFKVGLRRRSVIITLQPYHGHTCPKNDGQTNGKFFIS